MAVGTGRLFCKILIQNPNGKNFGIDISQGMLAKAKSKLSIQGSQKYSLEIGSAFDIKMDDGSIDILFNNYMFDLIPFDQMDAVIEEFKRVLKPGGKLVLVNMTKGEKMVPTFMNFYTAFLPRSWVDAGEFSKPNFSLSMDFK